MLSKIRQYNIALDLLCQVKFYSEHTGVGTKEKIWLLCHDALKDTSNGAWGAGTSYFLTGEAEQTSVLHGGELTKINAVV